MSKQRFTLACATDAGEGERSCRGDLVMGFALRDTPTRARGMVTVCRMIGMGRRIGWKDIGSMLDALKTDPAIDNMMLLEAVALWLDEQKAKEAGREWMC